jgi:hypothetical protein
VNAYANREGNVSVVQMFGGLARHKLVTDDAFEMVICHELGHHLGGAPKKGISWASNEGQSDYFATLKCAREAWQGEDNIGIVKTLTAPTVVTQSCAKTFADPNEAAICVRGAMAGKSLADTLGELGGTGETKFETPNPTKVSRTNDNHPQAQCRLDTYFAGSICEISKDAGLDDKDPVPGTCAMEKGAKIGYRPLCWYAVSGPGPKPTPTPEPTPGGGW